MKSLSIAILIAFLALRMPQVSAQPAAPAELTVSVVNYTPPTLSMRLDWIAVPGATSYRVYRCSLINQQNHLWTPGFNPLWYATGTVGATNTANITESPGFLTSVLIDTLWLYYVTARIGTAESIPSNVAGVQCINAYGGSPQAPRRTPFGLPFEFWDIAGGFQEYGTESRAPSDILGGQTTPGTPTTADRITNQNTGLFAYRRISDGTWQGQLEVQNAMNPGNFYWYDRRSVPRKMIFLTGAVNTTGGYLNLSIPQNPNGFGEAPFSLRTPYIVHPNDLGLLAQGFRGGPSVTYSDWLVDRHSNTVYWYNTGNNRWYPDPPPLITRYVRPWDAFLICVRPGSPFTNYTR